MANLKGNDGTNGRSLDSLVADLKRNPLFMDELSEELCKDNPAVEALLSLRRETSPEEQFNTFKAHGDECFAGGEKHYHSAKTHYVGALKTPGGSEEQISRICRNMSSIEKYLENYGSCIRYSSTVLKVYPQDIQSSYNLAFALSKLGRYEKAEKILKRISDKSPASKKLLDEVVVLIRESNVKNNEREKAAAQKKCEKDAMISRLKYSGVKIASVKNSKVSNDQLYENLLQGINFNGIKACVEFDPNENCLIWPVIICCPEHKISELIAKFNERTSLQNHLCEMFDYEKAPWDTENIYKSHLIDVYFEFPLDVYQIHKKFKLFKVDKNLPLSEILQHPKMFILNNSCPVFHIFSKLSQASARILQLYDVN